MVLPGSTKSFDQFRADDANCRQYAYFQAGGESPQQVANTQAAQNALIGTVAGAAIGAAVAGGKGAAIGAGSGLLMGSVVGAESANTSGLYAQERYDISYIQCMYAQGHRVPVSGQFTNETHSQNQPLNANIPPPPPGAPPAPPVR